jgi:hypothetical protein
VIGGERGKRPPSFLRLATKDFGWRKSGKVGPHIG